MLFFDLAFVGAAARANVVRLGATPGQEHVWLYVAQCLALFDCWVAKSFFYRGMYVSPDLAHKALDVIQGLLVALMAASVAAIDDLLPLPEQQMRKYVFAGALLLYHLSFLLLYIEAWRWFRGSPAGEWARHRVAATIASLVLVLGSLCAVSPNIAAAPDALLCGPFLVRFAYGYAAIWSAPARTRPDPHPADMLYDTHRAAEMVLVMIGEGIISISGLPHSQQLPWVANFALAFFLLALLKTLYFFVSTRAAHAHAHPHAAARSSRARALTALLVHELLLLALGFDGGVMIPALTAGYTAQAVWPLMICIALIWLTDLVGEWRDELRFCTSARTRALVYAAKLWSVAQIALNHIVLASNSTWLLLLDCGALGIALAAHAAHIEARARDRREGSKRSWRHEHARDVPPSADSDAPSTADSAACQDSEDEGRLQGEGRLQASLSLELRSSDGGSTHGGDYRDEGDAGVQGDARVQASLSLDLRSNDGGSSEDEHEPECGLESRLSLDTAPRRGHGPSEKGKAAQVVVSI